MFNLFPKKKSVDEILEDSKPKINITAEYNDLLKENIELKKGNKNWMNLYQEVVDKNNELIKEVLGLRHLKQENLNLIDRVNEIDSDVNRDLQDQLFTLKNDYALLRAKNNTLQEFIDTKIKVDWKSARIDILERDLQKCAEQRDEYKHQLNAANKEIEALQKEKEESFEILKKAIEDESARFHDLVVKSVNTEISLEKEIEKLKKDIVDYVFEKDDRIEQLQKELNHMKAVAEGAISLCDLSDKTDWDLYKAQKHPMYPIHWGGYDGACSEYPEQYSKWLNEQKDKATEETIDKVRKKTTWVEEPIDWKGEKAEESWKCPCNKCKEEKKGTSWEEAASDLALRVVKLEKQIKELTLTKLCQKPS